MVQRRSLDRHESGTATVKDWDSEAEGKRTYPHRVYYDLDTQLEGELFSANALTNDQYGWSWILDFKNFMPYDGLLYQKDQRVYKDDADISEEKFKVFSFGYVGIEDAVTDAEELAERVLENDATIKQDENKGRVPYYLRGGQMALEDDDGNEVLTTFYLVREDDEMDGEIQEILTGDEARERLSLERARIYFGTNSDKPKSASKRAVRVFSEGGEKALRPTGFDENGVAQYNTTVGWYDKDIQLAEDLVGDRVRIWKSLRNIDGNSVGYHHLSCEWAHNGERMPVRNGDYEHVLGGGDEDTAEEAGSQSLEDVMGGGSTDEPDDDPTEGVEFTDQERKALGWIQSTKPDNIDAGLQTVVERGYVDQERADELHEAMVYAVRNHDL